LTINIIIPVFNRLLETKNIVSQIRKQICSEDLLILIVNDGSTDGTSEWINKQKDLKVINGNGHLYWAGAINLGIEYILKKPTKKDWILLINNDVDIKNNYVESLLKAAKKYHPAVVGSIVKNKDNKTISLGPKIYPWLFRVDDLINFQYDKESEVIKDVDALSGRGVIFPLYSLINSKGLRPKLIPHYFADYDLSLRLKKRGFRLITSLKSVVYTSEDFEILRENRNKETLIFKLFSKKSSSLIYSKFLFWWEASNNLQKICLPLRIILFIIKNGLRKFL